MNYFYTKQRVEQSVTIRCREYMIKVECILSYVSFYICLLCIRCNCIDTLYEF